jgi:hypothetical protein
MLHPDLCAQSSDRYDLRGMESSRTLTFVHLLADPRISWITFPNRIGFQPLLVLPKLALDIYASFQLCRDDMSTATDTKMDLFTYSIASAIAQFLLALHCMVRFSKVMLIRFLKMQIPH